MNIYIGNLPYNTTEAELIELFSRFGEVIKATLVMDRETGRPRGFGFVEMDNRDAGEKAVEELSGAPFNGRPLTINEARPRQPRPYQPANRSAAAGFSDPPTDESDVGSRGYSNSATKPSGYRD